jgi:hypothetical protein
LPIAHALERANPILDGAQLEACLDQRRSAKPVTEQMDRPRLP